MMKNKVAKIFVALAMVAALLAVAVGCGSAPAPTTAAPAETTAAPAGGETAAPAETEAPAGGKKIAFNVPSLGNDFMVAVSNAMKEAIEAQGCTFQIDSCDGDVTKQTDQIENYAQMGFDAIVIWPVNAEGLASVVQRIEADGVQCLGFTNAIDGATASMVSADDYGMGEAEADMANEWIEKTFPDAKDGEVKVLFIASSSTPEAVQRSEGIQTLIEKNPKVTAIIEQIDWNDPIGARNTVENALLVNNDIKCICAVNGTSGVAANSYVTSANSPITDLSQIGIFSVDDTEEIDDLIKASENNTAALRGTVSMGTIGDTVHDFMLAMQPFIDGGNIETIHGSAFPITPESFK